MKDKYLSMKNIKADIDFSESLGNIDLTKHSFGIGGINPQPVSDKIIKGMAKLKPALIRIFIQEFFFIEKSGELDFTALDKYIKSVSETGADIMASICIKPKSLYPVVDENIWKPNNINRWQYIIEQMVKRYSVENKYVTHWGVANEINIGELGGCPYKINKAEDYFEYYKMTVEPILKVFPNADVGGPSWAGMSQESCDFIEEFINLCLKEKIQLDFISYNIYSDNPEHQVNEALRVKNTVDKFFGKSNKNIPEIYITELNVNLGGLSIEERAYIPQRAAGLGAIIQEFHKRADFIKTFQYHIYDQFCDPKDFKPFYERTRYMANHWSDEAHRLGLFDEDGNPRPQYFMYSMLNSMAKNEIPAKIAESNCDDIRITASFDERHITIFLTNYNAVDITHDLTLSVYFKNAREGAAKMTVHRIDENIRENINRDNNLELIPVENRTVYIHEDFRFAVYIPADSVVMITFDYL